jgi:hypothetical protein
MSLLANKSWWWWIGRSGEAFDFDVLLLRRHVVEAIGRSSALWDLKGIKNGKI